MLAKMHAHIGSIYFCSYGQCLGLQLIPALGFVPVPPLGYKNQTKANKPTKKEQKHTVTEEKESKEARLGPQKWLKIWPANLI